MSAASTRMCGGGHARIKPLRRRTGCDDFVDYHAQPRARPFRPKSRMGAREIDSELETFYRARDQQAPCPIREPMAARLLRSSRARQKALCELRALHSAQSDEGGIGWRPICSLRERDYSERFLSKERRFATAELKQRRFQTAALGLFFSAELKSPRAALSSPDLSSPDHGRSCPS